MKKSHIILLAAVCTAVGIGIGLAFDGLFSKAHAENENTELALPEGTSYEVLKTGSTARADYEIVTIYGRKYIIFSSGGDIEVLNY